MASHVPFDGWTNAALVRAAKDIGLSEAEAQALAPRGPIDLAAALHRVGDRNFAATFARTDVAGLRYSEKVARAVWLRLEAAGDRDVVRKATALFSLPQNAVEGATLMWQTADAIWTALGDTSRDLNWYSKRLILSGVYGSSVLYWLGDGSDGSETRAFIDRRIEDVMRFEKLKGSVRASKVTGPLARAFDRFAQSVPAPKGGDQSALPGLLTDKGPR